MAHLPKETVQFLLIGKRLPCPDEMGGCNALVNMENNSVNLKIMLKIMQSV